MGARTDLAEREVAAQRARVSSLLGELEERVQDDAHGLGDALSEQTSSLQDRVTGVADDIPGRQVLNEQVMRHPLTMMLSGVAVGVALGVASSYVARTHAAEDEVPDRSRGVARRDANGTRAHEDGGSRLMDTLTAVATSSLAGPVKHELESLAREALAGFLGEHRDTRERRGESPPDEGAAASKPALEEARR